jgi:hypothetical protein
MTYKGIQYTPHAAVRMSERAVTRAQVRATITAGTVALTVTKKGRTRHARRGVFERRTLEVVYFEDGASIEVITVYWVD